MNLKINHIICEMSIIELLEDCLNAIKHIKIILYPYIPILFNSKNVISKKLNSKNLYITEEAQLAKKII